MATSIVKYYIFIVIILGISGCYKKECQLLIKNVSEKQSIYALVKINGKAIFNDTIQKSVSSIEYTEKNIMLESDTLNVEVEIPQSRVKKLEKTSTEGVTQIIITIHSIPISSNPIIAGDLSTIPKEEEVLIAFFPKRDMKKKMP